MNVYRMIGVQIALCIHGMMIGFMMQVIRDFQDTNTLIIQIAFIMFIAYGLNPIDELFKEIRK